MSGGARLAKGAFVHPTAIVEDGVEIGEGASVWDSVHVRRNARIGAQTIVGEKSYVAYDVRIGSRVKINAMVYVCAAVTIEDGVMIAAGTTFTNDRLPRATTPDLRTLRSSAPDEHTLATLVREGATIGAGSTVGCDLTIGRFAMIGMGSLVTKSIADFHLAFGHPAVSMGCVCRCGEVLARWSELESSPRVECPACGLGYALDERRVRELAPPA